MKCSRDDCALGQLLTIILHKYNSENKTPQTQVVQEEKHLESDSTDPYGLYGYGDDDVEVQPTINKMSDVDTLCLAFSV